MEDLFLVFVPPVVPPAIPGQPPYYYVIYGTLLSLMGITLSSTALFAFNLTEKVSRIVYCIGCFLSICFGVYCGNMLHPLVAVAVGVVLTIISIFAYFKSIEWKRGKSYIHKVLVSSTFLFYLTFNIKYLIYLLDKSLGD